MHIPLHTRLTGASVLHCINAITHQMNKQRTQAHAGTPCTFHMLSSSCYISALVLSRTRYTRPHTKNTKTAATTRTCSAARAASVLQSRCPHAPGVHNYTQPHTKMQHTHAPGVHNHTQTHTKMQHTHAPGVHNHTQPHTKTQHTHAPAQ